MSSAAKALAASQGEVIDDAEALARRIESHATGVWLLNTGWTGGPEGVGERLEIARYLISRQEGAAAAGDASEAELEVSPASARVCSPGTSFSSHLTLDPEK